MIYLQIGDTLVGIPGEALAEALIAASPEWLVAPHPAPPAPSPAGAAIKAGAKAVIPMLLAYVHKSSVERGMPLPPLDLKGSEARASLVAYAIRYLLNNFAAIASQLRFTAEGGPDAEGTYIVTGITAQPAHVVSSEGESPTAVPALAAGSQS